MANKTATFRLLWKDALGSNIPPIYSNTTDITQNNATDITKQPIMRYTRAPLFRKDHVLAIAVKPAAATTLGIGSSSWNIPVTYRNIDTGMITETFLTTDDFTAYVTYSGTTFGTIWTDFAYYTIPSGMELVIGQKVGFNSRIFVRLGS